MGRYIDWEDVIDRYPSLNTIGGADETSSTYIVYGEAYIDAQLSNMYTVPFSNNNMTVRDLVIDYVYWRAGRFKLEDASAVQSAFFQTIAMIKKGQMAMIDADGSITGVKKAIGIFSSTESYHSSFGMRPTIEQHIDQDLIDDERDRADG